MQRSAGHGQAVGPPRDSGSNGVGSSGAGSSDHDASRPSSPKAAGNGTVLCAACTGALLLLAATAAGVLNARGSQHRHWLPPWGRGSGAAGADRAPHGHGFAWRPGGRPAAPPTQEDGEDGTGPGFSRRVLPRMAAVMQQRLDLHQPVPAAAAAAEQQGQGQGQEQEQEQELEHKLEEYATHLFQHQQGRRKQVPPARPPPLLPGWAGVPLAASRQDAAAAVQGRAQQLLRFAATSPAHHAAAAAALTAALALLPPAPPGAEALLQHLRADDRLRRTVHARAGVGRSNNGGGGGGGDGGDGRGNGGNGRGGGGDAAGGEPLAAALLPAAVQLVAVMRAQGPSVLCPHDPSLPVANGSWWRQPSGAAGPDVLLQQRPQRPQPGAGEHIRGQHAPGDTAGSAAAGEGSADNDAAVDSAFPASAATAASPAAAAWPRVLVAANLRQAELLLPFWSLELLRAVAMMSYGGAAASARRTDGSGRGPRAGGGGTSPDAALAPTPGPTAAPTATPGPNEATPAQPPPQPPPVAVSIYESGSSDATPVWLEALAALLDVLGVPNAVVTRGALRRAPRQHRIEFLASVRNQASAAGLRRVRHVAHVVRFCTVLDQALLHGALRVLDPGPAGWHTNTTSCSASASANSSASSNSASGAGSASGHPAAATASPPVAPPPPPPPPPPPRYSRLAGAAAFRPERLLFLNDVYACAPDLLRLLQLGNGLGADLACGLDFDRVGDRRRSSRRVGSRRSRRHLLHGPAEEAQEEEEEEEEEEGEENLLAAAVATGANVTARAEAEAAAEGLAAGAAAASAAAEEDEAELRGAVTAEAAALVDVLSAQRSAAAGHRWDGGRPYEFYDIWVARDVTGRRFDKRPPIAFHHGPSALRLALGLPTAAFCCWNGAALLDAGPFLSPTPPSPTAAAAAGAAAAAAAGPSFSFPDTSHNLTGSLAADGGAAGGGGSGGAATSDAAAGDDDARYPQLRFRRSRSAEAGECDASECSLLCHDLHRLGRSRVVVDPWVRLSYVPYHDTGLHEDWYHGAPMLTWAQLQPRHRPAAEGAAPPVRPRTAQQVLQLKLALGGLWWQASRSGLSPPDIDAALAAAPSSISVSSGSGSAGASSTPRSNATAGAATSRSSTSTNTSAWPAPPPPPPPLAALRSCLEGEWAALARRVATPPPSLTSPALPRPTTQAELQQLQPPPPPPPQSQQRQPSTVVEALAELAAAAAAASIIGSSNSNGMSTTTTTPAPGGVTTAAAGASSGGGGVQQVSAPPRAPAVLVRTLGPAGGGWSPPSPHMQYECVNMVPFTDVADFPGASLRDLASPNHTAAYLEEERRRRRRQAAAAAAAAAAAGGQG
ncbi:hypothetical protein HXX76_006765 [Chlamydomonas incerta]|uniref:Uncharacterized protein n=1 Tax=Chlamydomonas incerta TaxID=51695 RepID=A0A835T024_CHLIN|nr:hypothetical protein HXX76_006765 [Chlamydomonas incerta]|eukprot:KAG2436462.1 hypothetical protein HXX76_006765 [Chlamydomonas incerta]